MFFQSHVIAIYVVMICKVYVNKLGALQFFIEQGNKQVFWYSYWLVLANHCPIRVFC